MYNHLNECSSVIVRQCQCTVLVLRGRLNLAGIEDFEELYRFCVCTVLMLRNIELWFL